MKDDLLLTVELGGFNFPTYNSLSVLGSAQQVKIAKNSKKRIKVLKVDNDYAVIIKKIRYRVGSQQAMQDLHVNLWVGNNTFKSGKLQKEDGGYDLEFEKEDRTPGSSNNYYGGYLTSSSAYSETKTFPDNFSCFEDFHSYTSNSDKVYWAIANQSNFYDHVILLELQGWKVYGKTINKTVESLRSLHGRK